ncbi:hypothetical protein PFISCL1PPCAC_25161, partial [Pristionchus fissidentatus]
SERSTPLLFFHVPLNATFARNLLKRNASSFSRYYLRFLFYTHVWARQLLVADLRSTKGRSSYHL